ncbi:MAG TPA: ribonuclease Z [Solirubrobacteraceae bacterium]|jgi:ribonuclease Z|nr:ribonuclease Z [Solirubrobacteraceae bacterium]
MDLSIFFAGTAGSVPSARRGLPGLLVRRGADRLLFDCGEGTQRQLVRSVGLADLDAVFITHLHADHWLGLPGMLKSFELRDRERPLTVYGPPGLQEMMGVMRRVYGRLSYELSITEVDPGQPLRRDHYEIRPFPVRHRGQALGYALIEDDRPGRFDAERARSLGVSPGPDFGRLQRGVAVGDVRPEQVLGAPRPGRRLVMSGDTCPCEAVLEAARGADLLVHEATFGEDELDRARMTMHSTAAQAAEVAREARVRLLALTHISPRYAGGELREQARAVFPATEVPRDLDTIELPLAERGEPELVRWQGRSGGVPEADPAPV